MKHDAFIRSVYGGILAGVVSLFIQFSLVTGGVQNIGIWKVAAGIFLPVDQIATPIGNVIGVIGHFIICAIWGGFLCIANSFWNKKISQGLAIRFFYLVFWNGNDALECNKLSYWRCSRTGI